jgi:hypothetical protein
MNLHTPREFHFGSWESRGTPESSEGDCRSQNSMAWRVFYINGKLLERRCLKWAHIAHLDIWNKLGPKEGPGIKLAIWLPTTKSQESTRFFMRADGVRHIVGKILTRPTTLLQTSSQSKVCTQSYGTSKLQEFQPWQFRDSHLGVQGQKVIWMWASWRGAEYTIRGKVVASPKSGLWWVLYVRIARGSS